MQYFKAPLKIYYAMRLLRCPDLVGIEILMYFVYTPVSALRPLCTHIAHNNF